MSIIKSRDVSLVGPNTPRFPYSMKNTKDAGSEAIISTNRYQRHFDEPAPSKRAGEPPGKERGEPARKHPSHLRL